MSHVRRIHFRWAAVVVALIVLPILQSQAQVPLPGNWRIINPLDVGRFSYTATALPNGKILIAGGASIESIWNTALLYDPSNHTFTPSTHLMNIARWGHTATALPDGTVLLTGGQTLQLNATGVICNQPGPLPTSQLGIPLLDTACAELYDSNTDTFRAVGSMSTPRIYHTATLVNQILVFNSNGVLSPPTPLRVLIAGGIGPQNTSLSTLEYYDFYLQSFKTTTATFHDARDHHTATWLPSLDRILFTGGNQTNPIAPTLPLFTKTLSSAEVYDPASESIKLASPMTNPRQGHTATALNDGAVLIAGGWNNSTPLSSAEIFDPQARGFRAPAPCRPQGPITPPPS